MNTDHDFYRSRILPHYMIIGLCLFFILLSSVFKQDLVLRIAVYGPLISGSFALLLMVATIDIRHGLSSTIESKLRSRFFKLEIRFFKILFYTILLLFAFNLSWFVRLQLQENNIFLFGLSIMVLSIIFGLFIGSSVQLLLGLTSKKSFTPSLDASITIEEQKQESHVILSNLVHNSRHKLNNAQKMIIEEQKNACYDYIEDLLKSSVHEGVPPEISVVTNAKSEGIYDAFVRVFQPTLSAEIWSIYHHSEDKYHKRVLDSILFLDATLLLLYKTATDENTSDQIFWSILTVVSTMIDSASHLLQEVNDGTAMINVSNDVDEEQVKIMRLFCKVLISSDHLNWDPILVNAVKKRLYLAIRELKKNEEIDRIQIDNLSDIPDDKLENMVETVAYFIQRIEINIEYRSKNSFTDPLFKNSDMWYNVELYNALISSVPTGAKYTLPDQLLFCLLVLNSTFENK